MEKLQHIALQVIIWQVILVATPATLLAIIAIWRRWREGDLTHKSTVPAHLLLRLLHALKGPPPPELVLS